MFSLWAFILSLRRLLAVTRVISINRIIFILSVFYVELSTALFYPISTENRPQHIQSGKIYFENRKLMQAFGKAMAYSSYSIYNNILEICWTWRTATIVALESSFSFMTSTKTTKCYQCEQNRRTENLANEKRNSKHTMTNV